MTSVPATVRSPRSEEAASADGRDLRDVRWALGIWAMVLVFALVTAWWSHHVGIPLRDPDGKMFRGRLTSAVVLLGVLCLLEAAWRTWRTREDGEDGEDSPDSGVAWWRRYPRLLVERWWWRRLALALAGLVAYHCVYICYRNLKSWDAFNQPRDDSLLRLERWVFGGNSPASLLHDLLGEHTAAYVLADVYRSFTYLVPLSVVGALVLAPRLRQGYVMLASAMWVWVLGVTSYYLVPTLGPFASAAGEFTGLPHTAITVSQEGYTLERARLLLDPAAPDAFASISAFASLHVGFTCMVLLMLRYYRLRVASWVLTAYLAAVMVATVYFGWHFVVDVVAGVLLAALAVLLGRWTVYPTTRGRPAGGMPPG